MLVEQDFCLLEWEGHYIFISAPPIPRAPFIAVLNSPDGTDCVAAPTKPEILLAICQALGVNIEDIMDSIQGFHVWIPGETNSWQRVGDSEYYIRVSPFVQPGVTLKDDEFFFFVWSAIDNGCFHAQTGALFSLPDIDRVAVLFTGIGMAHQANELNQKIVDWLRSQED